MPCNAPRRAWRGGNRKPGGNLGVTFNRSDRAYGAEEIPLPCGQCMGCRIDKARNWTIRICHESMMHDDNCFVTLTLSDEHVPLGGTLVKSHLQKFVRKLREITKQDRTRIEDGEEVEEPIRYYGIGEYGDLNKRPHYHICLFNYDFPDKQLATVRNGNAVYNSEILRRAWTQDGCLDQLGYSETTDLTEQSAQYVARYVQKKITGPLAEEHYLRADPRDMTEWRVLEEFAIMSLKPGIGYDWLESYCDDIYPGDKVIINGKEKGKPPPYYDRMVEELVPHLIWDMKAARKERAKKHAKELTKKRLATRERCQQLNAARQIRQLEETQNAVEH